jgi:hypothetical protein
MVEYEGYYPQSAVSALPVDPSVLIPIYFDFVPLLFFSCQEKLRTQFGADLHLDHPKPAEQRENGRIPLDLVTERNEFENQFSDIRTVHDR